MSEEMSFVQPMRQCLVLVAKTKNIKLQHPIEEYDVQTMLKMFKEMEHLPVYCSPKQRLKDLADKSVWYFAHGAMWIVRGLVFVITLMCRDGETQAATKEFRVQHDRVRKEKYNA